MKEALKELTIDSPKKQLVGRVHFLRKNNDEIKEKNRKIKLENECLKRENRKLKLRKEAELKAKISELCTLAQEVENIFY